MSESVISLVSMNPPPMASTSTPNEAQESRLSRAASAWKQIQRLSTNSEWRDSVLSQLKQSDWKTAYSKISTETDVESLYESRRSLDKPTLGAFLVSLCLWADFESATLAGHEQFGKGTLIMGGCTTGSGFGVMKDLYEKYKAHGPEPLLKALTDVASRYDQDQTNWTAEQKVGWIDNETRVKNLEKTARYLSNLAVQGV